MSPLWPRGSARRQRPGGAREGTVLRAEPERLRSRRQPRAGVEWMCCGREKSRLSVGTGQVRPVSVQFASASVRCRRARGRGRGRARCGKAAELHHLRSAPSPCGDGRLGRTPGRVVVCVKIGSLVKMSHGLGITRFRSQLCIFK